MNAPHLRLGQSGEGIAERFLRSKGYRLLGRNVRVGRLGEIDLVVEDRGTLVFVEVKTRSGDRFGSPEDALTPAKRLHLARAIAAYLCARGLMGIPYRCDVVGITQLDGRPEIGHHRNIALE